MRAEVPSLSQYFQTSIGGYGSWKFEIRDGKDLYIPLIYQNAIVAVGSMVLVAPPAWFS